MRQVFKDPSYEAAWQRYRWRALAHLGALLGGFLSAALLAVMRGAVLGGPVAGLKYLGLSWFITLPITSYRVARWPCPRCGHPFHQRGEVALCTTPSCLHCGLPKWAASAHAP
ncbi:hypothetical protein DRW03_20485 [Corallococcus sp. H22C18031201]|uniref:hypothetical protein n=1 Tax=Citreicoccus inhibens TaxID=2849499 RepID=UPI000E770910|nr:hypothetical protein [Citreicoccus inhibens]MBU8895712.1 hypothetical protein [Citreicoccus inhibens]RJS20135.1 hypothetical protein DRW03_20485 [Corallococcus sp. H22C18031201]